MSMRTLHTPPPFMLAAPPAVCTDSLAVQPPRLRAPVCNVWNSVLFAPEGDGGGGGGSGGGAGDEKRFSQADVDRFVQDRVKGMKAEIENFKTQLAGLDEIKQKLADADERETKAREEAELKGKSEVDQLKIQLQKSQDHVKKLEAEHKTRLDQAEGATKQANDRFVAHVQRSAASDALNAAGLAKTAVRHAPAAFMSEAQFDLDEHHGIKSVTYDGRTFDKPSEAAVEFLKNNPHFAPADEGGAGSPRQNGGGGAVSSSLVGLLSQPPGGRA